MKKKLILITILVLSLLLGACAPSKPKNEEYPSKKINLVLGWASGGITDRVARVFAPLLEKHIGQPVTVINKEGASGAIGTDFVHKEPSDGYTLLLSAETLANFQVLDASDLSFEDFDAISMLIQDLKVIVVAKDSKYNSFQDLVEDIRSNPGKIKMSYTGPGASGHLQGLLFQELGLDVSMTPYGGGSAAMIAAIGGEVDFTFGNYGTIKDYLEVGDLKALATFTKKQSDILPEVPPMTDILKEAEPYLPLYFPNVLLVNKDTPEDIKTVLREATAKALADPEWERFVEEQSYTRLDGMTLDEIDDYWKKYTSITSWLLYDADAAPKSPEEFGIERFNE